MHSKKRKGAFHEPGTCLRLGRRFPARNHTLNLNRRAESKSKITSKSKTESRFKVPMPAQHRNEPSSKHRQADTDQPLDLPVCNKKPAPCCGRPQTSSSMPSRAAKTM